MEMFNTFFKITTFLLLTGLCSFNTLKSEPLVSIITSVYNADEFIEGFLAEITRQTIFSKCELIIVNANSPGNEEPIIKRYVNKYPNIRYLKLEKDPGLYGVWNLCIKMAQADFITNSNVDDRRDPKLIEYHFNFLNNSPDIDLVYSGYLLTSTPNETWEKHNARCHVFVEDFSEKRMSKCLPGPQPMWRKSLHDRYGYFDESFHFSGDFEFWNRAASQGSKFKNSPGFFGLIYDNPKGLSTDKDFVKSHIREVENYRIIQKYKEMWGWKKT